eukprot:3604925-Rhodomonas_salina.1
MCPHAQDDGLRSTFHSFQHSIPTLHPHLLLRSLSGQRLERLERDQVHVTVLIQLGSAAQLLLFPPATLPPDTECAATLALLRA